MGTSNTNMLVSMRTNKLESCERVVLQLTEYMNILVGFNNLVYEHLTLLYMCNQLRVQEHTTLQQHHFIVLLLTPL